MGVDRHEPQFGGTVIFVNTGTGKVMAGLVQQGGIQLGPGGGDFRDVIQRIAVGQRAQQGGHRHDAACFAQGALCTGEIEAGDGMERGAKVKRFGHGIKRDTVGQRAGGEGVAVFGQGKGRARGIERSAP